MIGVDVGIWSYKPGVNISLSPRISCIVYSTHCVVNIEEIYDVNLIKLLGLISPKLVYRFRENEAQE